MTASKVQAIKEQIEALPEHEQRELARAVLPLLLSVRAGRPAATREIEGLSDQELDAIIERARARNIDLPEEAIAAVIAEGLRAVRAARGS